MTNHQPELPKGAHSIPPAHKLPVQQAFISADQYDSFTYQKWFARQTGLSVDEAIALGLAKRVTP